MCLAIPMKVIEKEGNTGKVRTGGITYDVNFTLIPDINIGDYVIIHAGFAIERLDVVEAEKTLDIFRQMYENQKDRKPEIILFRLDKKFLSEPLLEMHYNYNTNEKQHFRGNYLTKNYTCEVTFHVKTLRLVLR